MAAQNVTAQLLEEYKNSRLQEGAANATVNRELAALQTAFRIAKKSGKLRHLPDFPHLKENNKRTGFITDAAYSRLTALATELWLRLWLELAYTYRWRSGELRGLKISQVDLASKTIRLEGSQSKNGQPRVVAMTKNVFELVKQPVVGKSPDDRLLTRQGNKPIGDFRKAWWKIAVEAGLGKWACRACGKTITEKRCSCGGKRHYEGMIRRDFRRSAAQELRRAGVPESVIMDMAGKLTACSAVMRSLTTPISRRPSRNWKPNGLRE